VGADADLVRELYAASYSRLVGQLYGVCGDLTEAEDVVQEAFARAVQHERAFARVDNHEAWLRTVAVNVARTRWRRRTLGRRHEDIVVARMVELSDDRLQLVAALRRLPAAQREAIALHYLADLPVHEVAATVGASIGTVKSRLSRGRTALAVLLRDEHHDPATAAEVRHA
jgi:RNA polymerase sigma-70 factor (ECF subfamily)